MKNGTSCYRYSLFGFFLHAWNFTLVVVGEIFLFVCLILSQRRWSDISGVNTTRLLQIHCTICGFWSYFLLLFSGLSSSVYVKHTSVCVSQLRALCCIWIGGDLQLTMEILWKLQVAHVPNIHAKRSAISGFTVSSSRSVSALETTVRVERWWWCLIKQVSTTSLSGTKWIGSHSNIDSCIAKSGCRWLWIGYHCERWHRRRYRKPKKWCIIEEHFGTVLFFALFLFLFVLLFFSLFFFYYLSCARLRWGIWQVANRITYEYKTLCYASISIFICRRIISQVRIGLAGKRCADVCGDERQQQQQCYRKQQSKLVHRHNNQILTKIYSMLCSLFSLRRVWSAVAIAAANILLFNATYERINCRDYFQ